MALRIGRIETIISASKVHRNTHRMHNLIHGLLEPITQIYICVHMYISKTNHIKYKKNEELHKARAIQMSKPGECTSTAKGNADCHQKQDATHRPNNKYAKT